MEKGKGLIEKYIERVKKLKKDQILIFVLAGVLLLIIAMPIKESGQEGKEQQADTSISSFLAEDDKDNHDSDTKLQEISIQCDQEYVERMEAKLKQLIGDMEEAGRVEVLITLKSSQEKIVEKDIPIVRSNTEETDAQGGVRTINSMDSQEKTIYETESGKSTPYVIKTVSPQVEGVVVVCEGAGKGSVNKNISDAIQVLFGIEAHKIKVVKMKTS